MWQALNRSNPVSALLKEEKTTFSRLAFSRATPEGCGNPTESKRPRCRGLRLDHVYLRHNLSWTLPGKLMPSGVQTFLAIDSRFFTYSLWSVAKTGVNAPCYRINVTCPRWETCPFSWRWAGGPPDLRITRCRVSDAGCSQIPLRYASHCLSCS